MNFSAKTAASAAILAVAAALAPTPASAQWIVACPTCASVFDQLRQVALDTEARAARAMAYVRQGQQYANQVQNTISIPRYVWASLQNDVRMVQGILGQGPHYALNSGFSVATLGTYAGYLGQVVDMPRKYSQWSAQANSNTTAILRGIGLQQQQLSADQAVLSQAQGLVTVSSGQVQAIQAHAMLTAQVAAEIQKLRQIQMALAQQEANRLAIEADQRAVSAARLGQFLQTPPVAMSGGQRY